MKKIIIFLVIFLKISILSVFAFDKIETVFLDIDKNYKYYQELQTLYNNWFFNWYEDKKFEPSSVLSWLEFKNIISKYNTSSTYFCQDESLDCVENSWVSLKKAIEVLLINSWLYSSLNNNQIISLIWLWELNENLSNDVWVKNSDWTINYYYWFLKKALEISYREFDIYWNQKSYNLLKVDNNWNINPEKYLTKEEFLNIFYIIYKLKPFWNIYLDIEKDLEVNLSNTDTDWDGIFDDVDKCIDVKWFVENNWCPILSETCLPNSELDTCKSWYSCSQNWYCEVSIQTDLEWTCIYPKNGSSIFWNVVCNTCPCDYSLDFLTTLRKCDQVFSAIVSPDWEEIYSDINLYQIPYEK